MFPPRFSVFLFVVAVFAGSSAVLSQRAIAQDDRTIGVDQVIDGEQLRRLGIARLGDVLRHVHSGRILTTDGFSHRISLNGLGSYHEPGPALYVDGHPIDISLFGADQLNLLGVPIEAIDRVEIVSRPTLIYGSFAGRGAIHIHTRPEVEGLRTEAAVSAASEVGDPGPFAYLDEVRNRDTQAPHVRGLVEVGGESAGARISGVFNRFYLTKPEILERMFILQNLSDAPIISVGAPAISGSWGGSSFGVNVIGLGAFGKLYPFLPYASREVSANYSAGYASAVVQHELTEKSAFRHRLTVFGLRAEQPEDSNVPFRWQQESLMLNTAFGRSLPERVVVLGGTARFDRGGPMDAAGRNTATLYAAIAGRLSESAHYQGGGMLTTDWLNSALKAYGGVTIEPAPDHRGDFYLSIAEDLPYEQNAVDSWARLGAEPALWPPDAHRLAESVSIRATGDADWTWSPNVEHELTGGFGVRVAAETYTFRREIEPLGAGFRTASIAYDYAGGTSGVVWMEYAARLIPGRQRVFWHQEVTLGGDDLYREVWRAVPNTRVGLSAYFPLAPDFEVEAGVIRQSGSEWDEYAALPDAVADVGGSTLLDLAFYKRLFAGRFHLRLALRNLVRDDVRYHPIGDVFDLTAQIDLRVEFGTRR